MSPRERERYQMMNAAQGMARDAGYPEPAQDVPQRDVPRQLYELECAMQRLEDQLMKLWNRLTPITRGDKVDDSRNLGPTVVDTPSTDVSRRMYVVAQGLNRLTNDLQCQLDLLEL